MFEFLLDIFFTFRELIINPKLYHSLQRKVKTETNLSDVSLMVCWQAVNDTLRILHRWKLFKNLWSWKGSWNAAFHFRIQELVEVVL